jgi:hypothetical protein
MDIPNRTRQESNKINYIKHYDKIRTYANIKYNCNCGGSYSNANKIQHIKTNKHIRYLIN